MIGPTFPLPIVTVSDALERRRQLVEGALDEFGDDAWFRSDVGVVPGLGRPHTTAKVEAALARAFGGEDAILVQGAGTGAIRTALSAGPWHRGDRQLLLHDGPDYSTTATTFAMGLVDGKRVDFNDSSALRRALDADGAPGWLYLQHTRQQLSDSYSPEEVIQAARQRNIRVIVDDNYAVLRTPRIGVELGAATSAFSLFKLHGPEGVGVVIGDRDIVDVARTQNYSGGGQVQGHQAMFALQQLIDGALNWAYGAQETVKLAQLLADGAVPGIIDAKLANVQDLCVVAELAEPISNQVRKAAARFGAGAYPVGANSRYEIGPLVYRLSGSVLAVRPDLVETGLRINPMRATADQVVSILMKALT